MSDPAAPTAIESAKEVDWSEFRSLWGDGSQGRDLTRVRSLAITIAIACWVAALILIAVTWNQVAELSGVADQIPWLVSGGISAIVLAIVGCGVLIGGLLASMAPRPRSRD
ncbi:MAG: hypothetical protein WA797_02545 [Acidimicrobiales bacterium]